MRLRDMNCARFLHRANAPSDILLIKLSREYLRLLFPGLARSSLNSTCGIRPHSGFKGYRLYAETPLSLLGMRDAVVPLTYGVPPPGIACGVSAARFTAPRYRNSASVSLFISHPASFPSRVSSVLSIMSFHTEIPARTSSTNYFYRTSR